MFVEDASGLLLPKGLVTVELADADTGRVTDRETADNFLSNQAIAVLKWFQRMAWGAYIPTVTSDAGGNPADEMPWSPMQHLAYWNDAAAEDSATEDRVAKDLVGWASRHPVGSPTGKRGVVNIAESQMTDTQVKWVFDWGTAQGNGTFQSVGWTRVWEPTGFPSPRFPENDRITFTVNGSTTSFNSGFVWDATASLWYVAEYNGTNWVVKSAAAGGGALSSAVTTLPGWSNSVPMYGFARMPNNDWITAGTTTTGIPTPRLARITTAGVQTWLKTEAALTNVNYIDVTVDGSGNIWTSGTDGLMRRHNPADGSIVATVTPLGFTVTGTMSYGLHGIAYDPADGNFWVMGSNSASTQAWQIWKVDATGAAVGPFYNLNPGGAASIVSTAPWAGNYRIPQSAARDSYLLTQYNTTTGVLAGSDINRLGTNNVITVFQGTVSSSNPRLAMKGTDLWVGGRSTNSGATSAATNSASPLRGGTLGTRSRLSSPKTKSSAQTLKVTYTFTFA